jgi:hypothetical protein
MSGSWYIDPDAGPVEAEDDRTYDEEFGPSDPHQHDGRLVEDDEGIRADDTAQAIAHIAVGDHADFSAEEAAVHIVEDIW